MKKFSKILVLLLSFVAIVTAFTVVALANDETTPQPFVVLSYDFEENEEGAEFKDASNKSGRWSVEANPEDANKYLAGYYSTMKGETGGTDNLDVSFEGPWSMGSYFGKEVVDTSSYDIKDYPIFAFDFDIMSPTGKYDSAQINIDIRGSVASDDRLERLPSYSPSYLGLTDEAYVWSHVTAIVEYAGDGVFNTYFYINGEEDKVYSVDYKTTMFSSIGSTNAKGPDGKAGSTADGATDEDRAYAEDNIVNWTDLLDENGNLLYDNIRVAYINFNPCNKKDSSDNQVCYDNMQFTYYPASYSVKDVVGAVYDEDYRVPYGKTTAQVTDKNGAFLARFDSVEKAIAFAGETDIVNIVANTTATYMVEKKVTIYTNGYDFKATSVNYKNVSEDPNVYTFRTVGDLYDGVFIDRDGNNSYFNGYLGFEAAVQSAIDTAGYSTKDKECSVVLYNDIEYYKSFTMPRYIKLVIDLNGNTLTRVDLNGTKFSYDTETSAYVESAVSSAPNAFVCPRDLNLTIKSSKEGGEFRTISVNGTAYYDADGKLESYTASSVKKAGFMVGTLAPMNTRITLDNIDIYAEMIFSSAHSSTKDFYFTMTGCSFYKTIGQDASKYVSDSDYHRGFFFLSAGGASTVTFKDSLFYIPDASVKASNQYYQFLVLGGYAGPINATVDNCDIISDNSTFGIKIENAAHTLTVTNSRLYGINHYSSSQPSIIGQGNAINSGLLSGATLADQCVSRDKNSSITYNLPQNSRVSIDPETKLPVFDFSFKDTEVVFTQRTDLSTNLVDVEWRGVDGEVLATTKEFKDDVATIPTSITKVPSGNSYTAFTNPVWLNADGKEDLALIEGKYYFTAALPENPEYVAYVTDVLFNMSYMDMFTYRIYVPVVDGVEITMLGAYGPGQSNFGKVMIDGKQYYASVAAWRGVNRAADSQTTRIQFKAHGQSFEYLDTNGDGTADTDTSAKVSLSALLYAEIVSADKSFTAVEKDAVLKMMAYVEQIYILDNYYGDANKAKFDNFFNTYNAGSRPAAEAYDQTVFEIVDGFSNYVKQFNYAIYTSGRLSFGVTLNKSAVDAGYTLDIDAGVCNGFSKKVTDTDGNVTYYTYNTSLVYVMLDDNYKIYVKDAEGNVVATQDYNLATYCAGLKTQGINSALPDAIYTFGKAIVKVREYLSTL